MLLKTLFPFFPLQLLHLFDIYFQRGTSEHSIIAKVFNIYIGKSFYLNIIELKQLQQTHYKAITK